MSTEKAVIGASAAFPVAMAGTEMAVPVVPFLEAPLWMVEMNGVTAAVSSQQIIVGLTGVLGIIVLLRKVLARAPAPGGELQK